MLMLLLLLAVAGVPFFCRSTARPYPRFVPVASIPIFPGGPAAWIGGEGGSSARVGVDLAGPRVSSVCRAV